MNYRRNLRGLATSNANAGATPIADAMLREALTRKPPRRPLLPNPSLNNAQPACRNSTSVATIKHISRSDDKSHHERSPLDDQNQRRLKRKRDSSSESYYRDTYHERNARSRYSSRARSRSPKKYERSSYKSYRSPPRHYRHGSPIRYHRDRSRSLSCERNRRSNGGRDAHLSSTLRSPSPIRNHSSHYHHGSYQGYNRGRAGFRGGYNSARGRHFINPAAFSHQQPTLHYHSSPQKTEDVQKNSFKSSVPQKNTLAPPCLANSSIQGNFDARSPLINNVTKRHTIEERSNLDMVTKKPHMTTESSYNADVAKMLYEFRKQSEVFHRSRHLSPVRQQRRNSPSPVRGQVRQRRSMSVAPTRFDGWRSGPSVNPRERPLHPKEIGRYSYLEKEHHNSCKNISLPRNDALGNSDNGYAKIFVPHPTRSMAIPHSQLKDPCIVNARTIQATNFTENLANVNNLHNNAPQKPSSSYTGLNILPTVRIVPIPQSREDCITTIQSTAGIAPTPQSIEKPIANVQVNQTQSYANPVSGSSHRDTRWNPSNDWQRNDFSVPPSIGTMTVQRSEEPITNGHMNQAQTFNHHSSSSSSEDDKRDSDNEIVGNSHESNHAVYDFMTNKVDISDEEDNGDTDTSPDKDSPEQSDEIQDEVQFDQSSDGEADDKNTRMRKLFCGRCVIDINKYRDKIMSQGLRPQIAVGRVYPLPLRKTPLKYVEGEDKDESVGSNETTRSQGQVEEHLTTTENSAEHREQVQTIQLEQASHHCQSSHVEQQIADKMVGDYSKNSRTTATLTPTKVIWTVPPASVVRNIPPPTINPPALCTEEQVHNSSDHNVVTDENASTAYYNTQVAPTPKVNGPTWIGEPPPNELMSLVAWGDKTRQNGCRRLQTNRNPQNREPGTPNKRYSF